MKIDVHEAHVNCRYVHKGMQLSSSKKDPRNLIWELVQLQGILLYT